MWMDISARFHAQVDLQELEPSSCHLWTGRKTPRGYGKFRIKRKEYYSHRIAYELAKGPIPDGLQIDHLCRNTSCCNPDHLEAVTSQTNTLRGVGVTARNSRKTHCPQGHEYTPENTYYHRNGGDGHTRRRCRTCERARQRARYSK